LNPLLHTAEPSVVISGACENGAVPRSDDFVAKAIGYAAWPT
jgi:hypothetical protein